jgi:hypothetical protein
MVSTGAINYSATTDLVNGAAIAVGGRKCTTQGYTWQDGEEVEGAINSDSIDLATDYESEIHFALDCSGAADNTEYEFELWDDTKEAVTGTVGATIKMETGAVTREPLQQPPHPHLALTSCASSHQLLLSQHQPLPPRLQYFVNAHPLLQRPLPFHRYISLPQNRRSKPKTSVDQQGHNCGT